MEMMHDLMDDIEGDWYGQMTSKNAEALIDSYLNCKKIYPPAFRGKMVMLSH